MSESPRDRIIRSINDTTIDYDTIKDVLQEFIDKRCESSTRYEGLKNIMEELNEPNNTQDEPYETARKLALLTDGFSILAHIHSERGSQSQLFLRTIKDQLMTKITKFCIKNRINVGVSRDECALEIDLPYVGHIGWHFGRPQNMYGLMRDTGVTQYPYRIEDKISKDGTGFTYSNADLLVGMVPMSYLNRTDKNLIKTGNIHGRTTYEI